jgi:hypothetical protein
LATSFKDRQNKKGGSQINQEGRNCAGKDLKVHFSLRENDGNLGGFEGYEGQTPEKPPKHARTGVSNA